MKYVGSTSKHTFLRMKSQPASERALRPCCGAFSKSESRGDVAAPMAIQCSTRSGRRGRRKLPTRSASSPPTAIFRVTGATSPFHRRTWTCSRRFAGASDSRLRLRFAVERFPASRIDGGPDRSTKSEASRSVATAIRQARVAWSLAMDLLRARSAGLAKEARPCPTRRDECDVVSSFAGRSGAPVIAGVE